MQLIKFFPFAILLVTTGCHNDSGDRQPKALLFQSKQAQSQLSQSPQLHLSNPQASQSQPQLAEIPAAFEQMPPSAVNGKSKTFHFTWQSSAGANRYTLCQKESTQPNQCRTLATTQNNHLEVELKSLLQAQDEFFVIAENPQGVRKSNLVSLSPDEAIKAIGYIPAPDVNANMAANTNSKAADSRFAHSIALSDDGFTLAVGAFQADSCVTATKQVAQSGAVYIYSLDKGKWRKTACLSAPNANKGDQFGYTVALSQDGNIAAISALKEASNAKGVDGDMLDNSAPLSGAVYLFERHGAIWQPHAYIKASNSERLDSFGFSLSLSANGQRLLVGAPAEASSAQGVNGNQDDNSSLLSGAAYLFEYQNNHWQQSAYLKASNSDSSDSFGYDVALSKDGNTLAIGAPGESSKARGIKGVQSDNSAINSGAVYLFTQTSSNWAQDAYIKAATSGAGDQFGYSVSLDKLGQTLAVGAFKESSNATSYGDESNNLAPDSGAAYLFVNQGGVWSQQAYLKQSNPDAYDRFGYEVQLNSDGTLLAVAAPQESSASSGLFGDQQDNSALSSGAVYVFTQQQTWQQSGYLKAKDNQQKAQLGSAIALNGKGDTLAASTAASLPNPTNGSTNTPIKNSGAVYVF